MEHVIEQLTDKVREAARNRRPLHIRGSGSKDFYGRRILGEALGATAYRGIVSYEPTELVLTARAGTPLKEIEAALASHGQMLPFEPPHFAPGATLGGCIAAGLSGPRRPYAGAVRDYVLGVRMIDGRGDVLRFGGQVMKNVAGYDLSRLMAGSLGTLGMLLEVSVKVLPLPVEELTLRFEMAEGEALDATNRWAGQPFSLSATCYRDGELMARLSGASSAVRAVRQKLGGEAVTDGAAFWESVREQTHPFFRTGGALWRLSLPSTAPAVILPGKQLVEWGGALRWLAADADAATVRAAAAALGGQAALFRSAQPADQPFHPLSPALHQLHLRLKQKFDPQGIFNPGRMYGSF